MLIFGWVLQGNYQSVWEGLFALYILINLLFRFLLSFFMDCFFQLLPLTWKRSILLFISYKFVKDFFAITCYYLLFPTETYIIWVNFFYIVKNQISAGSDKGHRISAYTPIIKIAHFWQRYIYTWRCQSERFYNGGLWGKFAFFFPIQLKFRLWLHKKRWHLHVSCKFQQEIRSNRKVIAIKRLTN